MVFQNIWTSKTDYYPEKPHRRREKWNDPEMAPQDFEIAQNRLGNGAGGISGHGQRKVAQKRT
jgi:hypothetical protein